MGEPFLAVAPTDVDSQGNRIRQPLAPIAAWQLADHHFAFDSSLLRPTMAADLLELIALIRALPESPLTIYGHADPTGDDNYNKALSGRRATALYALLTRRVDLWVGLASNPLGSDDWKKNGVADSLMREHLAGKGDAAAKTMTGQPLMSKYMDAIAIDDQGKSFGLPPRAFLGQGKDKNGKADYQGCSEFNPLVVFSQSEAAAFAAPSRKPERDQENAPNRRVTVFLFQKGTEVSLDRWPCPRVNEGIAGCQARFWSDAPRRRANGPVRRTFPADRDTFACRFYDRLDRDAHPGSMRTVMLQLHDPALDPVPNTSVTVQAGATTIAAATDAQGWLNTQVPTTATVIEVIYTPKSTAVEYRLTITPPPLGRDDARYLAHLRNFGYGTADEPDRRIVLRFQAAQKDLEINGHLDGPTKAAIDRRLATALKPEESPGGQ